MSKELKDLSFDELVKWGVETELDNVVQGQALRKRVWQIMDLAARWSSERTPKVKPEVQVVEKTVEAPAKPLPELVQSLINAVVGLPEEMKDQALREAMMAINRVHQQRLDRISPMHESFRGDNTPKPEVRQKHPASADPVMSKPDTKAAAEPADPFEEIRREVNLFLKRMGLEINDVNPGSSKGPWSNRPGGDDLVKTLKNIQDLFKS